MHCSNYYYYYYLYFLCLQERIKLLEKKTSLQKLSANVTNNEFIHKLTSENEHLKV